MSSAPTYHLCPLTECIHPPPEGTLRLGSIIRSTSAPQFPLNQGTTVPIDAAEQNPNVVETDWKKTISTENAVGLGVYAQFLKLIMGGLDIGPELGVECSRRTANKFAFDSITTISFEPTSHYVEKAVKAPAVQAWLKDSKQRFNPLTCLFIVTGIKLVKGASIRHVKSQTTSLTASFGVDVLPPYSGITAGLKNHWSYTNDNETEFNRATEFVFAFRVKRLRFRRQLKIQDYNKGAMLTSGNDKGDNGNDILIEDVDGSQFPNAELVPDTSEHGDVYCVPA